MAYFSQEEAKEVRKGIKLAFKGVNKAKFSITVHNHSEINVIAMRGPFKFKNEYAQLNEFHEENYNGDTRKFLQVVSEVIDEVKTNVDRNAGDMGADYPAYNYFKHIGIGKWDREFEPVEGKVDWKQVKENVKKFKVLRSLQGKETTK